MNFTVIIPARLHSTRLPGKVLLDIHGKPMLQHVYERAIESGADKVIIATDHEDIVTACEKFDAQVCMTDTAHQSGTERLSEAVTTLALEEDDIVVCLQADEPQLPPQFITQVAQNLSEQSKVKVATLATKITNVKDLLNPNIVKVILNYRNHAMVFSRAPIPWNRDQFGHGKSLDVNAKLSRKDEIRGRDERATEIDSLVNKGCERAPNEADRFSRQCRDIYFRHIGIYAYRAGFLETYMNLAPCAIETCESLEQLRVLWNGYKIHVGVTDIAIPASVDTRADLERVRK